MQDLVIEPYKLGYQVLLSRLEACEEDKIVHSHIPALPFFFLITDINTIYEYCHT